MSLNPRDELWGSLGYTPSKEQLEAHDYPGRYKIIAGGEQAGKSFSAGKEGLWRIVEHQAMTTKPAPGGTRRYTRKDGLWWIVGPTYEMCRPEYMYLAEDLMALGLTSKRRVTTARKGQLIIQLDFGRIETKTAEDATKIAAYAPNGIIVCEGAQIDYYAWLKVLGRAAPRKAWVWASGTFEGAYGWYPDWWNQWQGPNPIGGKSFSIPTWSNLALYPGGRDDPEIRRLEHTYPPDMFQERFGAIPCPSHTLVFPEFSEVKHVVPMSMAKEYQEIYEDGRLVEIKLPWGHDVELWIDPGRTHAYAVLAIMRIGETVYHFDEIWEQGKTTREIVELCQGRTWWPRAKIGIMDVAGRQKHEDRSYVELWQTLTGMPVVSQSVPILAGIERHKSFLASGPDGRQRLYHSPKCEKTIWEYRKYKGREPKDDRPASDRPIDANNDSMKALAYGLVWNYGVIEHKRDRRLYESPHSDWTDRVSVPKSYIPVELR